MNSRSILALIFALIGCSLVTNAVARQQVFVLTNDVSLTILPARRSYKIGQTVEFVYQVRNISHAAIFVPGRVWSVQCAAITPPYVSAGLEDMSGNHYMPGYAGDCLGGAMKMDVRERMRKDSILLKPGQVFQSSFELATSVFRGRLKAGEYRLEAMLYGWNDKDFTKDERDALKTFGHPFLVGAIPASTTIKLM